MDDLVNDLGWRLAVDRSLAGEHLVDDDADGVLIGSTANVAASCLLGSHVTRSTQNSSRLGQRRASQPGHAEVGDLRCPFRSQKNVGGLHVAMNDAVLVCIGEGVADRHDELDEAAEVERWPRIHLVAKALPLDELHRDERTAVLPADVEKRDDVGMREGARDLDLVLETGIKALLALFGTGRIESNAFDRHPAPDQRVLGQIHSAHLAGPLHAQRPISAEMRRAAHPKAPLIPSNAVFR